MFLWILKPSSDNIETLLSILANPIQLLWIPQISPMETYMLVSVPLGLIKNNSKK